MTSTTGMLKNDVSNTRTSKNMHFACEFLAFGDLQKDLLIFLVINCHLGGDLVRILI